MDSYPTEFVIHLQPTLIITGLTSAEDASTPTNANGNEPPSPPPRPGTKQATHGEFAAQKAAFLQAMLSRNNVTTWDNTKGLAGSLYYVVPEQRSFILPPTRKYLQQVNQQHLVPSLSPSSPSSPLYPDGLISPLWVRRHRQQIPSVFIAVVDLWDQSTSSGNQADASGQKQPSDKGPLVVIDPMEREHDTFLAQELLERRKAAQDRGVKFAAVIMLQRSHMEDPSIEDRLNFVRKSAGLDTKNSFFVLPPSNMQEISDFAVNLQRSQYEGSMNYYKEQVKRHKKKKSNLPSTTSAAKNQHQQNMGGSQVGQQAQMTQQQQQQQQGLSVQGWLLRYDYKMGMFMECKQDIENAVKHYESAYGLLIDMFAANSSITPGGTGLQSRTKRWAEAKVLADTLCLKICKFHLYLDAPSTALFHFRRHLLVFKAFSDHWRMGEDSFEYWAWLSKQYRMFGDLVDIGTRSGFKLPVPTPGSVVYGSFASLTDGAKDLNRFSGIGLGSGTSGFGIGPRGDSFPYGGNVGGGRGGGTHGPGAGINPMLVLQHAGYFYHQAANSGVQRRLRFQMADEAFPDNAIAPVMTADFPFPPSLQSMNAERAVDHLTLTIELLTKSYEQFKRYKAGRMTLYLASEIAGAYYSAGKFDMALKFFERIAKTYRKEKWNLVLTSILKWSIRCAEELGFWELVVEYLIEMLSAEMPATVTKRQSVYDELVDILYAKTHQANTSVHQPILLSMPYINSFVSCSVQFQTKQSFISAESKFQVQLSTVGKGDALPGPIRISYIRVEFSDPKLNHSFEDSRSYAQDNDSDDEVHRVKYIDRTGRTLEWNDCSGCTLDEIAVGTAGNEESTATQSVWKKTVHLDIRPFETKVLEGIVVPESAQTLKATKVTLGIVTEHWNVVLDFPLHDQLQELIVPRESKVEMKAVFRSPAYLDECFPIRIKVRNGEQCSVKMELDVDFQMSDPIILTKDKIALDPNDLSGTDGAESLSQPLSGIKLKKQGTKEKSEESVGDEIYSIAVGEWAEQTIYVRARGIPTPRTITCRVQYEITVDKDQKKRVRTEKLHTFRIPFIPPFDAEVDYVPQKEYVRGSSTNAAQKNSLAPILEPNQFDEAHDTILIPALTYKERYLVSTRVNNEGPWPVEVQEVKLVLGTPEESSSKLSEEGGSTAGMEAGGPLARSLSISRSQTKNKGLPETAVWIEMVKEEEEALETRSIPLWRPGNLVTFNHTVLVLAEDRESSPEQVEVGYLRIKWRRCNEDGNGNNNVPFSFSNVPLKPFTLPKSEIFMTVDLPKYAQVNRPFTARYMIENPTKRVQELVMSVEPSEAMVYSGTMQTSIKVLPFSSHRVQMTCYPLLAGLNRLPRLKLVVAARKPSARRGEGLPPQQQPPPQEEVLVKIRGLSKPSSGVSSSGSSGLADAVAIFVRPEAGVLDHRG
ncbi:hypothetical protein BGW38_003138 [Lunasporangiospora selenospora]|uniref:Trafficking protein particle complex subunit 11 n=1 Tax=Lunasporangiospora selenospora TaxID=979761 RepID=A0A9P6KH18_9FUNG|nr:hypothetical protein BGW38_003138 [Lunasporangiospora selenospora]